MAETKKRKILALFSLLLVIAASVVGAFFLLRWKYKREHRFDNYIIAAARRYQADPALIKAVIWKESNFDPQARGLAGEIGLMQILEDAAWEWAGAEKFQTFHHEVIADPERNVLCGTYYLSKLMKRYTKTDNPPLYALADYNAGRTHVLRWSKGPAATNSAAFLATMDYPGTKKYALAILEKRREYQDDFPR